MKCSNCKATLAEGAKFCNKCGARVNVKLCPNGHVLDTDSGICRYCPPAQRAGKSTSVEKATVVETGSGVAEASKTVVAGGTRIFTDRPNEPPRLYGWLVIMEGDEQFRDFKIMRPQIFIGRSRDCDFPINDVHVSAKHVSLKAKDNAFHLTDLDSSNGTYLNGQEISKSEVRDNDLIKIGNTVIKFKAF